jgi:hypothetical protein
MSSIHEFSAEALRAELAQTRRLLADSQDECYRLWGENQWLKVKLEHARLPARDREYCCGCGEPRDQYCPCGAMFPQ